MLAGLVVWLVIDDDYVAPPPDTTRTAADSTGAAETLRTLVAGMKSGDAGELRGPAAAAVRNGAAADIRGFSARYVAEDGPVTDGSWPAEVTLTWRYAGFDSKPVTQDVRMQFSTGDDGVEISDIGGGDGRTPVWLNGPVRVLRTADTMTVVRTRSDAAEYARLVRQAVSDVRAVRPWQDPRLVVEVPAGQAEFEAALGADRGSYGGVAAVTATVDGSASPRAPVHVLVNPDVIGNLNGRGAQVVVSHEAVHAATGVATTTSMPMWLLEGFADYVALRSVDLPLSTTAGQILSEVRENGPPDHLPGSAEFDTDSDQFGREYESAWLACRTLAETAGEDALVAVYDDVAAGGSLEDSLRRHAGVDVADLTQQWQQRLSDWAA